MTTLNNLDIGALNSKFSEGEPKLILEYSILNLFKNKIAYVCSFGTESAIILHLISQINKDIPIILLNTHFLFEETVKYKNELLELLGLRNCHEVFPDDKVLNKFDRNNDLWKTKVDKCCNLRKVIPLEKSLKDFEAWVSGRKSYHLGDRQNLKAFEKLNNKVVVNPLFRSTQDFVENYFLLNSLPKHPLEAKGYLSIGCTNCTIKTKNIKNIRDGRWSNKNKTECGIHLEQKDRDG